MTRSVLDRPRLERDPAAGRAAAERRPARWRPLSVEGVAAVSIGWAMWYLAGEFGGVDLRPAVRALAPLLIALPAAGRGLAALQRRWGLAVAALCLGLGASVALASYRADMVAPLLTYGSIIVVTLATAAIWRRSWGPAAIAGMAVAAGARAWWVGFEVWYGGSLDAAIDRWMSLPWHNQSGALMAALAVALAVTAVTGRRWVVAASAASLALAATVLSGSRGSVVALAIGCAAGVAVSGKRWWRWLPIGGAAALVMVALTALPGTVPTDRGESLPAVESGSARMAHWAAAGAMFIDDPVTGQGVGAYRLASPRWAAGDVNPTSHAHNEYIELFAEGGIVVGVPAAVLLAALLVAAIAVLRRRGDGSLRSRVGVAAAATWLTLAAHAAVDFDWLFPLLAVAFALAAGVVVGSSPHRNGDAWPVWAAAAVLLVGLGAGYVEGFRQLEGRVHPPWNADAAAAMAETAIGSGDVERALAVSHRSGLWNPGDPRPAVWEALTRVEADGADPADVVAAAMAARPGFKVKLDAAAELLARGHHPAAGELVSAVIADFDRYQGWNLGGAAAVAYRLGVDVAGAEGCESARAAATTAAATPLATAFGSEDYLARAEAYCG